MGKMGVNMELTSYWCWLSAPRQAVSGGDLRLGERPVEVRVYSHDLPGGLHLGTQDGVHLGKLHERKDRLLYAVMPGNDFLGVAELGKRLSDHHLRSYLGQLNPYGLVTLMFVPLGCTSAITTIRSLRSFHFIGSSTCFLCHFRFLITIWHPYCLSSVRVLLLCDVGHSYSAVTVLLYLSSLSLREF